MSKPFVSLVVPFRNSQEFLQDCCAAIAVAIENYGPADLILVDNGSVDGSRSIAAAWVERTAGRLVTAPGVRVGQVRNVGAACSDAEIISFIDSDCIVPPNFLDQIVQGFRSDAVAAVGRRYALPPNPHWIENTWVRLHDSTATEKYFPGGNLSIERAVFDEINGFNAEFVAGEDAEICERIVAAGYDLKSLPNLNVIHLGNPKSLPAFWKQQVWHATAKPSILDLPFLGTILYICSLLFAMVLLWSQSWIAVVPAGVLSQAIPAAAVVFRQQRSRHEVSFWASIILYNLYFLARATGLFKYFIRNASG